MHYHLSFVLEKQGMPRTTPTHVHSHIHPGRDWNLSCCHGPTRSGQGPPAGSVAKCLQGVFLLPSQCAPGLRLPLCRSWTRLPVTHGHFSLPGASGTLQFTPQDRVL